MISLNQLIGLPPNRHLVIDPQGELQLQALGTSDRGTSHTNRTRINNAETGRTVMVLTQMSAEQLSGLRIDLAVEWLTLHLSTAATPQWLADMLEQDIYLLLAKPEVRGWWLNHWFNRDAYIIPRISTLHTPRVRVELYQTLHRECLAESSPEYAKLQDSYASLF